MYFLHFYQISLRVCWTLGNDHCVQSSNWSPRRDQSLRIKVNLFNLCNVLLYDNTADKMLFLFSTHWKQTVLKE